MRSDYSPRKVNKDSEFNLNLNMFEMMKQMLQKVDTIAKNQALDSQKLDKLCKKVDKIESDFMQMKKRGSATSLIGRPSTDIDIT